MAPKLRWRDPIGRETTQKIVKKLLPTWKNGLQDFQLDIVTPTLDGVDGMLLTATGDGKSAAFMIPILVLQEMARNPLEYPDLPRMSKPIGLVITPTKGLSRNLVSTSHQQPTTSSLILDSCFGQVKEAEQLGISAFAYCKENVADARRMGRKLSVEIKSCEKWSLVFVDPEHLKDPEWREITEWPVFRANIVFACVDEAHLIYEWGLDFRLAFLLIGAFFRGRLPTRTSVLALSATMQPGAHESFVLTALGFVRNTYILIRRSNERPNIQFSIETLSHGLGGSEFPSLLPYLNSGRKLVIHCKDINLVTRVFSYCGRWLAPGEDWFRRIRTYHALYSAEHNEATLDDMINDDECQVVIATVAFANGLNVKTILDSISLGVGDSIEQTWQQTGRAGQMRGTLARGVMLVQLAVITTAAAHVKGKSSLNITHKSVTYLCQSAQP